MKVLLVLGLCACALAAPQRRPFPQQAQQQSNFDQQRQAYQQQQQDNNEHQEQHHQQEQPTRHQQQQQYHQQQSAQSQDDRDRFRTTTYVPILKFQKEQGNDGSYKTAWETGNSIIAEEEGFLKQLGPDPDHDGETINAQVQHGSYSYTAPDGQLIEVRYTADEFGFRPEGLHLPTPPPVSPEVQKGLDLIYAGIKAQQELAAREAANPSRKQEQDYQQDNRQYRQ